MLKYSINKNNLSNRIEPLRMEEMYVSPDNGFVSGVTEDVSLYTGDSLMLEYKYEQKRKDVQIRVSTANRQGYIEYPKKYKVNDDGVLRRNIIYKDGVRCYEPIDGNKGVIDVDGTEYTIDNDGYVTIIDKIWVYDGKITIDSDTIEVDTDFVPDMDNTYHAPKISYDGKNYDWMDYEPYKWKNVSFVTIDGMDDKPLLVDMMTCGSLVPYIYLDGVRKRVSVKSDGNEMKYFIEDGTVMCEVEDDGWSDDGRVSYAVGPKLSVSGVSCDLRYELMSTRTGSIVILHTEEPCGLNEGDIVKVTENTTDTVPLPVQTDENEAEYVVWSGTKYMKSAGTWDFVMIGGKEHEIEYVDNDKLEFHIVTEDGKTNRYEIVNGKAKKVISDTKASLEQFYGNEEYEIIKYDYFTIHGEKFRINDDFSIFDGDVSIDDKPIENRTVLINIPRTYHLAVSSNYGTTMLKCEMVTDGLTEEEIENETTALVNDFTGNPGRFYLCSTEYYFGTDMLPYYDIDGYEKPDNRDIRPWEMFDIYKHVNFFNVGIPLNVDFAENLFQGDYVGNQFVNRVVEDNINRPMDMEKDIYYPAFWDKSNNVYDDITDIECNLHFRTRDLTDWSINEPPLEDSNWFIFDRYDDKIPMSTPDLLGFMGFTNKDVYMQKSKIAKSFLRITLYDDIDPMYQNLLYTGSVFMDEYGLFTKYINNSGKDGDGYVKYDKLKTPTDNDVLNNIGVFNEPVDENKMPTYDDSKRLAGKITTVNREATKTSSESFYLYMFRELGTRLHERKLYMHIDFCHAGTGKAIPMVLLPNNAKNTGYATATVKDDSNIIKKFKEGYALKELYEKSYIEISCIYDFEHKRYVYRFPEYIYSKDENTGARKASLNLFELKIKDESGESKTTMPSETQEPQIVESPSFVIISYVRTGENPNTDMDTKTSIFNLNGQNICNIGYGADNTQKWPIENEKPSCIEYGEDNKTGEGSETVIVNMNLAKYYVNNESLKIDLNAHIRNAGIKETINVNIDVYIGGVMETRTNSETGEWKSYEVRGYDKKYEFFEKKEIGYMYNENASVVYTNIGELLYDSNTGKLTVVWK